MNRLAILGGAPAFPDGLPFARPSTPPLADVMRRLEPSYEKGMLTNGPLVRTLEEQSAARLGVRHVVAVASCTAGLTLALRAVSPDEAVAVPSFTFVASAHAVAWNGLRPFFVDCDESSFQVEPERLRDAAPGVGGILATHVFGAPCAPERIEAIARAWRIPVIFDAAHAMGATRAGRPIGSFGEAEVFSLSPTKLVVGGEGGLIATNNEDLADFARLARDYGNPRDYDARFVGLNARMSELHAALAIESLARLDEALECRRRIADCYREGLAGLPGVQTQEVAPEDRSTYKDFTVAIDEAEFGLDRDSVARALRADGIDTRCYFSPPAHRQKAYAWVPRTPLPCTERVAKRVLSLPIFSGLAPDDVGVVVEILRALHCSADEVRRREAA
jgi:dTDP-4-amino-4,6-dideoxygalactose transaminase